MTEKEVYSTLASWITPEIDQFMKDELSKCIIVNNNESNIDDIDTEHIPASVVTDLIQDFVNKINFEVLEISTAIIDNQKVKNDAIFLETKASTSKLGLEVSEFRAAMISSRKDIDIAHLMKYKVCEDDFSKQNDYELKRIDDIKNPELYEIISKGRDLMKIDKYFKTVMEKYVLIEIDKCLLVRETESNNEEIYKEYVLLSRLHGFMETLLAQVCFNVSVSIASLIKIHEDLYSDALASSETIKIKNNILRKELEALKNSEKNYINGINPKEESNPVKRDACGGNKGSSIICRYANLNKKYEIILNRRQCKGKRGDL